MGQKTLPLSLRLNKTKNWKSSIIVSKTNYSNFIYFENQIKDYLYTFFNKKKIIIQKIKIEKNSKSDIFIYLFIRSRFQIKKQNNSFFSSFFIKKELEKNLSFLSDSNLKLNIINLNNSFLRKQKKILYYYNNIKTILKKQNKFRKIKTIKKIFLILNLVILTKNPNILSTFIFKNLQKQKHRHKKFLYFLNTNLKFLLNFYVNFIGFKIQFKGRINSRRRSQIFTKQHGKIPLNSLNKKIYHSSQTIPTPSGSCNVQFWLYFKESN